MAKKRMVNATKRRDKTAREAQRDLTQDPYMVVFKEMDRLRQQVDVRGWNSQQGHAMLNLMLSQLERLLMERSSLREQIDALTLRVSKGRPEQED